MRLFVAVDLPAEVREAIAALQHEMRALRLPVRWVRAEGIHLTLRFIGETDPSRVAPIAAALEQAAGGAPGPFRLDAFGTGAFPDRGRPRVVWVGVQGDLRAAARLATLIDGALEPLGLPAETRPFRPHLTIGRLTGGRVGGAGGGSTRAALERFAGFRGGTIAVRRFHLFESRLGEDGATYHMLATMELTGGDGP